MPRSGRYSCLMRQIILGENQQAISTLPSAFTRLIYIDPPFNTGKVLIDSNPDAAAIMAERLARFAPHCLGFEPAPTGRLGDAIESLKAILRDNSSL